MVHKPKLGQHFLRSKYVLETIIKESQIEPTDTILEVGPGKGVLTEALLKKAGRVIAVEKDARLVEHLRLLFSEALAEGKLVLVHADVRKIDFKKYNIVDGHFKLIANIPYYITGELLRLFFGGTCKPNHAVILIQKEVAWRIARSKKESVLSLSIRVYGTPRYAKTVSRKAFNPPPNVDSAVLVVSNISRANFKKVSEPFFFTLIKQGFSQKRKLLLGNLRNIFPPQPLEAAFEILAIPEKIRAEDVPLEVWLPLATHLQKEQTGV